MATIISLPSLPYLRTRVQLPNETPEDNCLERSEVTPTVVSAPGTRVGKERKGKATAWVDGESHPPFFMWGHREKFTPINFLSG